MRVSALWFLFLFYVAVEPVRATQLLAPSADGDPVISSGRVSCVPLGAATTAQEALEQRWKRDASASPSFYSLRSSLGVTSATLGDPFCLVVIGGLGLDRFLTSSQDDPTAFASVEKYCFPILLPGGTDAGTLIVIRNKDENGIPFLPEEGDFAFAGYFLPGAQVLLDVDALRTRFSEEADVYWVRFVDSGLSPRFMIRESSGRVLAGSSPDSLRSLEEDSQYVRQRILSFRRAAERMY